MASRTDLMGFKRGWVDAERFVKGTHRDRREIRRQLAKSADSYAPFWRGYRDSLLQRLEDFAAAIAEGRVARTCRPSRIFYVINHE
ncbi:hypothetical protein SAMN05444166_6308 [Singulisphaera sp. GP187]|uniref:hypothetical protein n=1 Tax=Singulisphaera sp. GP187 TaxID=1882752 RepID=UPI00092CBA4A|nr:hypothetical protein [Singulisphaera sp. GP187]SIO60210.1 hypothetical protein SAMN05444166_6308 [Singulisphaera sp. GP187]